MLKRRPLKAIAVIAGLLAACGGDESVPTGPPPPPGPPPPAFRAIFSAPIAGTPMAVLFYGAYRDQGNRDFECGFKFYAGHSGVDILLRNFTVQDSGVAVLAAAPGRVTTVVDDFFDRSTVNGSGGFGNHVFITHDSPGLVSIYGHLRKGSIRVGIGTVVQRGDTLALVGSSGNSNWPHLHFEVRENGVVVDPFIGRCNPAEGQFSWVSQPPYHDEFQVLDQGLTTEPEVSFADLLERPADVATVRQADESFLYWLNLFNVQAAAIRVELQAATGALLATAAAANVTTFSVRFFTVRFGVDQLPSAGSFTIVVRMTPFNGAEREIARRSFDYDPGGVPSPGIRTQARGGEIRIGPDGGERSIPGGRSRSAADWPRAP